MKNILEILREYVEDKENPTLVLTKNVEISESLKYHIDNELSLTNNIYRTYSTKYFDLVNEVRNLYENELIKLNEEDQLMVESDLGRIVIIGNEEVFLDAPFMVEEDETIDEAKHRG